MRAKPALPSVRDIRLYLQFEGWDEHPPGPAGSLWSKTFYETAAPMTATVAVPEVDDDAVMPRIVAKLSSVLHQSEDLVTLRIKYYAYDRTDMRAVNNLLDDFDSIPLKTAETIIASVQQLLRSCGTTAFGSKADLKGHYSDYGRNVMNVARMAHTKQGSFIIPVLVRLPLDEINPQDGNAPGIQGTLVASSPPEPIQRRVMRTFAQSMDAVSKAIIEPGTEPTLERLHAAVEMGVSREMCVALKRILEQPTISELDTTFHWAPAFEASKSTPSQVSIPAEARDLIDMAAHLLKNNQIEPPRTLSGKIIALRHEPETPLGLVTIATARNGRPAEVTVRLPYERYLQALEWHADRRTLIVHGEVQGGRGQRLHIDEPTRCEPIEDLFSEMNSRSSADPAAGSGAFLRKATQHLEPTTEPSSENSELVEVEVEADSSSDQ
jgi:hypothetical protein